MAKPFHPISVFFARISIDPLTGCHNYDGPKRGAYRTFHSIYAHRFAYEYHIGPIPSGFVVMHHCDNKQCVNPDHLATGTQRQNLHDMKAKGRSRHTGPHKLAPDEVRAIRDDPRQIIEIAQAFGVNTVTVWHVRTGRTWSNISGPLPAPRVSKGCPKRNGIRSEPQYVDSR